MLVLERTDIDDPSRQSKRRFIIGQNREYEMTVLVVGRDKVTIELKSPTGTTMLIVRKEEPFQFGPFIIMLTKTHGRKAKFGFSGPREISILREELLSQNEGSTTAA